MADTKVIVIPEGKICDYVDGKFRNDTPEEYVRQTIEKRLVNEHINIQQSKFVLNILFNLVRGNQEQILLFLIRIVQIKHKKI